MVNTKIIEFFFEMEDELDLLELQQDNIYVYVIARRAIFLSLLQKENEFRSIHNKLKFKDYLKSLSSYAKNCTIKNPFIKKTLKKTWLIDHPRKIRFDNKFIDIYTHFFIEDHKDDIEVFTNFQLGSDSKNMPYDNSLSLDFLRFFYFISYKFTKVEIKNDNRFKLQKLQKAIFEKFNVEIDVISIVRQRIRRYIAQYNIFYRLINKFKPNYLYIVASYEKEAIISAAQDLNVKVIEFQHGVITDHHIGYSYSKPEKFIPYFPNKILTFGDYWAKNSKFPEQTEIEVYGYPYLNEQLKKYKDVKKNKRQVIVLSQGTIGIQLSQFIAQLVEMLPEYNFIYKLHPGEYSRWREEYPWLTKLSGSKNFELIDNSEINLYQLLAESEFQIGVYSTAIYEGLTLGCKTILLELSGIEHMLSLIEKDIVKLVNTTDEVSELLENFSSMDFSKDYFFKN
ncbi:hypothetical protein [Oceanobacillus kimchii]|uniref:hypothetical protein n=1 Tax=Oceanobacillus kimchii TaxID=746691 RepID=UPI00098789F1|nr:hypothetical protein [Oceanobacillus kimchii]